jgi:hypothetical protein
MPRPIHYHVSAGAAMDNIFSSIEYWNAEASVKDFLDISYEVFGQKDTTTRATSEKLLYNCVDKEEQLSVVAGSTSSLMLVWSICTCDYVTCMN